MIDLFKRLDINLQAVKTELEQRVREDEIGTPIHTTDLVLNEKASNVLKLAVLEARIQRAAKIDEQHLLLAILHDIANNGAKEVLEMNNMTYDDARSMLFTPQNSNVRNGIGLPDDYEEEYEQTGNKGPANNQPNTTTAQKKTASKTPVLDSFGTDLTKAAAEGKLDPCVGRDREIQRINCSEMEIIFRVYFKHSSGLINKLKEYIIVVYRLYVCVVDHIGEVYQK